MASSKTHPNRRWSWKTFFPIVRNDNLPRNAQVFELDEDKKLVPTKVFDPENKKHFVKFPPYVRAHPKPDRSTRVKRRELKHARRLAKLKAREAAAAQLDGARA